VLVGEDQCGATTLLRVLAGLQVPDAGRVEGGPCAWLGAPPGEEWQAHASVEHALEAPHLLGRRMTEMSRGERQRVRLGTVLADPAPVVLLDEPFGYLDVAGIGVALAALRADGRPVLAVCKAHPVAAERADRVVTLEGGRLL
jgi:ABC-type sugar transport system ATPase subunit